MAINGSFYGKTSNAAIKPKITWSAAENMEGNYSDVTATLSYSRTDSYKTYGHWAGTLTINGDKKSVSSKYIEISKNSNTVAITHTVRVPHNEDGTKSIAVSATGGISGTTLTNTTISANLTLTSIPRAATIAATDGVIGSVSMVTIGKKSDAYTYTVAWQFGSLSGYLSESGMSAEAVSVTASSLAFPLPESFYYEIPAKPSDTCILTCTTFLNGSAIGEPQKCSFTIRADAARCAPVVTLSVRDSNPATLALTGNENVFIRYASSTRCTMTAQSRFGASLAERKLNGETVTADTVTLDGLQTDVLRFAAKDSRGYTSEETANLNLIPYFAPAFRLSAARTDATSGDATLQAEGSFYNGSFGAVSNSLQVQYQVNGGEPVSVAAETDGNSFSVRTTVQNLDYTQSHRITLTVSDALSTVSAEVKINPGIPVFEWGKADFRFNVPLFVEGKEVLPLVEEVAETCVRKTGDTMTGDLQMSGKRVTDLGSPQADTDAATKAYADGKLSMHLLWKNASPDSSFGAQTLTLDIAGYDLVLIAFHDGSTYALNGVIPQAHSGVVKRFSYAAYADSAVYVYSRSVIVDFSGGTVAFGAGYLRASVNNAKLLPQYIYGIQGVRR